jgi:hypothetical protein
VGILLDDLERGLGACGVERNLSSGYPRQEFNLVLIAIHQVLPQADRVPLLSQNSKSADRQ